MKFSSESARLEHPQARLIPGSLWDHLSHRWTTNGVTYGHIDDELLNLMTIDLAAIDVEKLSGQLSESSYQLNSWICLLLGHSDASTTHLLEVAQRLFLPPGIILEGALITKRLDIADEIEINPLKVKGVIAAHHYLTFRIAAANGHLVDVLKWLKTKAPSQLEVMIEARFYGVFRFAGGNGQLDVLNWLKAEATSQLQAMIAAEKYCAFRYAAENGHLEVLNWLKAEAPSQLQAMIMASDYYAFRCAAGNGHLDVLKWLKTEAPDKWLDMIATIKYCSFYVSAKNGHLDILKWFKIEAPSQLQAMIAADNYYAVRLAAENGHLDVLKWINAEAPGIWQTLIGAYQCFGFRRAVAHNHLATVHYLLSFYTCFAYAEMHEEHNVLTHPFIVDKLAILRSQFNTAQTDNPHAVFDIVDVNEVRYCFYMIRNLIRRNDPRILDDIRFLLEIPAVKVLAHQAVSPGIQNELVRLALTSGNREAADILLAIPAVHDLARTNDFYAAEVNGGFNLRELAQDRESSVKSLTTAEQLRLDAAIKKYQPLLNAAGPGELMTALRQQLEERYAKLPATIIVNGLRVELPVDWASFQTLVLDVTQRREARQAYYQNKNHTALRYLSRPNHWMASKASYVYINEERTERWSTFEEYQPLITLFWLAAMDKTTPAIDGYTIETRLDHFIEELAFIGRAHNWDKSRVKVGSEGLTEEYDDLVGDKPSCFSGVKRRLFQSVLGHPLFKMLTQELIDNELRDFVRGEFSNVITDANRSQLKSYFDTYTRNLEISARGIAAFTALNIPTAKQDAFVASLSEKYGPQFDAKMQLNLRKELALNPESDSPGDALHAFKFDEFAGTAQLLAPGISMINAEREGLKRKLDAYIQRIEGHKAGERPDYAYGFWFFKNSRAINREVNYLLAKSLLEKLNDPALSIDTIFKYTDNQREELIARHDLRKRKDYAERGINSMELNTIIKEALKGAEVDISQLTACTI